MTFPRPPMPPLRRPYRMPAEWEPHRATWLAWPHHAADWPGKFAAIPWVYAEIVRHLTQCETVRILVADEKMQRRARRVLQKAGVDLSRVEFYHVPTDRVWTRDYCPLFVVDAAGEAGPDRLAFQRLGQVSELAARRRRLAPGGRAARPADPATDGSRQARSCSRAAASTSTAAGYC